MPTVKISDLEKYHKGATMKTSIFIKTQDALLKGYTHIDIPQSELDFMENKLKKYIDNESRLVRCCELNNAGIEYEKNGQILQAIQSYEENIKIGYPAHHSFKRLMVYYRKNKDYKNEYRVISRALKIFKNYPEYIERLNKVSILLNKNK